MFGEGFGVEAERVGWWETEGREIWRRNEFRGGGGWGKGGRWMGLESLLE